MHTFIRVDKQLTPVCSDMSEFRDICCKRSNVFPSSEWVSQAMVCLSKRLLLQNDLHHLHQRKLVVLIVLDFCLWALGIVTTRHRASTTLNTSEVSEEHDVRFQTQHQASAPALAPAFQKADELSDLHDNSSQFRHLIQW